MDRYIGLDRPDAWANVSPNNVALHAVSAFAAFGDVGIALDTAAPLMRRHIPVPERRAALWAEAARAYTQQGRLPPRIADTLALGILCEAYGMGIPTAVLPYVNTALAAHPAYGRSLDQLREIGVLIGSYEPHWPKAGGGADRFRWEEALELLDGRIDGTER